MLSRVVMLLLFAITVGEDWGRVWEEGDEGG